MLLHDFNVFVVFSSEAGLSVLVNCFLIITLWEGIDGSEFYYGMSIFKETPFFKKPTAVGAVDLSCQYSR